MTEIALIILLMFVVRVPLHFESPLVENSDDVRRWWRSSLDPTDGVVNPDYFGFFCQGPLFNCLYPSFVMVA
jgi:hypothetical protein